MNSVQSLQALMEAPVIINDNIWRSCVRRSKKESIRNIERLSFLLQELYKNLLFNRDEEIYFLNLSLFKKNPIKVEIKFTSENKFFIAIS